MTDDEFSSHVRGLLAGSANFTYGNLAQQRIDAMDYYMGRPFGDEVRGRSQVVSLDVSDTVEGILPYLMKIFTASDRVVEVDATREDTVELAEQATDYLNWIFYKKNRGFFVLYEFFKDALLQKNGVIKYWREKCHYVKKDQYEGLTTPELAYLIQQDACEIEKGSLKQRLDDLTGEPLFDCTIIETRHHGDVRVKCVPPEEFVVNRRHDSLFLQDANLVCHRSRQTRSALLEMGYDADLVDQCAGDDDYLMNAEETARDADAGGTLGDDLDYGTTDGIYLYDEIYVRADKDGDGIDELYMVAMVGDQMLEYEEADQIPFVSTSPIIMTHRFHGRSIADLVMDIQRIKSVIQRQALDNLYLTNNPRMRVLRNMVTLTDLLEVRPGGIIRMDAIDAVQPLTIDFVARESFQVLGYFDEVKENRTGLTKYTQGMDSNSLNKTATGLSRIMDASKERIELIARIFADTGVAELFRGLLKLCSGDEAKAEIIRLRGKFVAMDPSEYKELVDVSVNVGLGTGNKEADAALVEKIIGFQQQAGPLGMCRPIHFYNSLEQFVNLSGRKDVSRFFEKPAPDAQMPQPPDPEQMKIDGQVKIAAADAEARLKENVQKAQIDADTTKHRIETQARTELQVAGIRTRGEVQALCFKEAMKIAAEMIKSGMKLNIDQLATEIMKAASAIMPESIQLDLGGANGSDGPVTTQ